MAIGDVDGVLTILKGKVLWAFVLPFGRSLRPVRFWEAPSHRSPSVSSALSRHRRHQSRSTNSFRPSALWAVTTQANGYRVCSLLDKGMSHEAIGRFVIDTFGDSRESNTFYASLFAQYATGRFPCAGRAMTTWTCYTDPTAPVCSGHRYWMAYPAKMVA